MLSPPPVWATPAVIGQVASILSDVLHGKGLSGIAKELNRKGTDGPQQKGWGEHILTADDLTRLVHLVNEEMDSACKSYRHELNTVSDDVANISHRLERLQDAAETGKIDLNDLAQESTNSDTTTKNCRPERTRLRAPYLINAWS